MGRELLLARICAGVRPVRLSGDVYELRPPTRTQKLTAEELYEDVLSDCLWEGVWSKDEVLMWMRKRGLWGDGEEKSLANFRRESEDFKVHLFGCTFKTSEKEAVRKHLRTAEREIAKLESKKEAYWHTTAEGCAHLAKSRYLAGVCLYREDTAVYSSDKHYWNSHDGLGELVLTALAENRVSEKEYRDLARNEPWRSLWNAKCEKGLFGGCAVDLGDEQKALVVWSNLYDRVFEHPECPGPDVIEDDDALDGFLIVQRRKRVGVNGPELSEKVANAEEVYLPVNSIEDARKLDALNDEQAKKMKAMKLAMVRKYGAVNEQDMPDAKRKIQMAAAQR